jgi:NAD(P)H-dependent nitrite reductase small subunit
MIIEEKEFKKVCKTSDLSEGFGRRFMIDDVDVAIFKVDGEIYALSNICPHQKAAIIHNGFLEDGKVVCPAHGWEFNLKDGCQHGGRRGLDSYEIKIENDDVFVKVFTRELDW